MDDRIGQILDHRLVDLGVLSHQHQLDVLAEVAGEVACDARVFLEQATDRLHAGFHDCILQIRNEQIELAYRQIQGVQGLGVIAATENIATQRIETILGQPDLTGKIEHLIQASGIDANRVVALTLALAPPDRSVPARRIDRTAADGRLDEGLWRARRRRSRHRHGRRGLRCA